MLFDTDTGEIYLYGICGSGFFDDGFTDLDVINALKEIGDKRAVVRINSPGGSVDEGVAVHAALMRHGPGVTIYVDSVAASIASFIMLAGSAEGNDIQLGQGSRVMIHRPWTIAVGDAAELRKTADVLDIYESSLLPSYAQAMGQDVSVVASLLADETWFTAADAAKTFKNATESTAMAEPVKIAAGMFRHTPSDMVAPDGDSPDWGKLAAKMKSNLRPPQKVPIPSLVAAQARQKQIEKQLKKLKII